MLALSPFPKSRISVSCNNRIYNSGGASTSCRVLLSSYVGSNSRKCSCLIYGSKERDRPRFSSKRGAVLDKDAVKSFRSFVNARNEEELLSFVRKEVDNGRISAHVADGLEELYLNYRNAVSQSGIDCAEDVILSNMAVLFDRILLDVEDPFTFEPYHVAIREPFDYYLFSQNYIRPLLDFRNSYVGNISLFDEIEERLQKGHNIVLMSNHQTEADPAVVALLIERTHPQIAEKMVWVAGDRVISDPLCKPFSMGRNLLCVYSKKHMNDVPEEFEEKKKANTKTLKKMALLLRTGSHIIWIAPSGGRDRPDPRTGEWHPEPFDASSVDNMRRLLEHSKVEGHIYPFSLLCYNIMPPPAQVEKQIGERRKMSFHGVGLSVAPEMNFKEITANCVDTDKAKEVFSQALYNSVTEQYSVLKSAILEYNGIDASNSVVSLSQPWIT